MPPEVELPARGMGFGRRKGKEEGGEMKEIKPEVGMKRKGGKCKTKPGLGWGALRNAVVKWFDK